MNKRPIAEPHSLPGEHQEVRTTMFCRTCFYDLHAQQTPRCPECGTPFDFEDRESFYAEVPGSTRRVLDRLRPRRMFLLSVMLIPLFLVYAFVCPDAEPFPKLSRAPIYATVNLKCLMTTWLIQAHDFPEMTTFDKDASKKELGRSYSAWTEQHLIRRSWVLSYLFENAWPFAVPALVYLLFASMLVKEPARRLVYGLIAALSLWLIASAFERQIIRWTCPSSYAYLDDIVCVPDVDLSRTNPLRTTLITAFDIQSFRGSQKRLVAFGGGNTDLISDERARQLFQAQGIPYPEPPE